ncbi:nuclear factor Y, subunit B6 [Tasmannia lanceolata]|uniref:nuclear factor Y, subunit B6 n=1 Tax=Tasmannia lanceolata TaxID=3420 RepID=UPI004063F3BF
MERGGFHGYQRLPKSTSATVVPDLEAPANQYATFDDNPERDSVCTVREQDRFMPIANVIRIMRKVLPTHAKISDDAKETIQECVSEYISFITSEANERCQREQRKTITAEDVLWAMNKLGFDDYIDPLSTYLQRYREVEGDHRGSIRGEPLPKRSVDMGGQMVAPSQAYAPPGYHMGHHQGQFNGGVGAGYFRDGSGTSSGQAAGMAGYDPYAGYKC